MKTRFVREATIYVMAAVIVWLFVMAVAMGVMYAKPAGAGTRYVPHHGTDVWADLAHCESTHGKGSRNVFQFSTRTWRTMDQRAGVAGTHTYDEQLESAMELQERDGWGQWPACSRAMGLR